MKKSRKSAETAQEQPKGETINNVVVTVVISPGEEGKSNVSHNVLVNGKSVDGIQVGLVLTGKLQLAVSAGVEHTTHMRGLAAGARGLAENLTDSVLGVLLTLAEQQVKANENGAEPPVPSAPSLPSESENKVAQTA